MDLTAIALMLALNAAPVEAADAQEHPACECGGSRSHELKGNNFLFPLLQQTAFVSTFVSSRSSVAVYDVPDLPVGVLGTQDISLTGLQQSFELGIRLTRWLGLSAVARGNVYSGLTIGSFASDGAAFLANGDGGVVVRLLHSEASGTQLSLRAAGGYAQGRELSLFPLLSAIVDNPGVTLESILRGNLGEFLVTPTSEASVLGGLYLAQALGGRVLSLQASASARHSWRTSKLFDSGLGARIDQDTSATRFDLAAALAVDFQPLGAPLALMGEYLFTGGQQTEVALARTDLHSHSVGLGLYYSGRRDVQLGVGAVRVLQAEPRIGRAAGGERAKSGEPTLTYGQAVFLYSW